MKKNSTVRRISAVLLALGLLLGPAAWSSQYDESNAVNNRRGDASPAATGSHVDDYLNQDEQINIDPNSGVVKVLRTNQKNLINDYVVEVIPIQNVHPREIRQLMRQITGAEGGRAEVIRDSKTKQNFVEVICPAFQLPYIRQTITAIDQPWVKYNVDGAAAQYYTARYRDIRAVDEIASVFAGDGESEIDLANNAVYRWDEPYRADSYFKKGVPLADIPINLVLLDVQICQVDLANDNRLGLDYISWKNGPGRNLAELIVSGMKNRERFVNLSSIYNPLFPRLQVPGPVDPVRVFRVDEYSAHVSYLLTAAYLDFLVSKGRVKTLTSTRLLARSGQGRNAGTEPARFEAVEDVVAFVADPNDTGVNTGIGARPTRLRTTYGTVLVDPVTSQPLLDEDGNPRFTYVNTPISVATPIHNRTLDYRMRGKVGIFLEVIPHVGLESCEMEIQAGVSSVAGTAPDGMPILAQRRLSTQLSAPNGQPVVLSGLSRMTNIKNNARMPILGKIPVLGYLAGGEQNASRDVQVVFVITPTIITGPDSAATMGAQAREIKNLAQGLGELEPPKNPLGFDQWLLDRQK